MGDAVLSLRNDDAPAIAHTCDAGRGAVGALTGAPRYPDAHAEAVSRLAHQVGAALGLSGDDLKALVVGALVHDIGKLRIDASILRKPAPLTTREWQHIRRHPDEGAGLLGGVFAESILAVVRWHHERWDGRGYPDALAGDAIPLPARIVAVADAFRAMLEPRPYRLSVRPPDAAGEILRASGSQFDPACVDALLSVVGAAAA